MELEHGQVLLNAIHSVLDGVHTAIPGVFVSYDYTKKEASVKPTLKRIMADQTVLEFPVIQAVPVIWPGTSKALIHCEITPNVDCCLLVFSERALENWLTGNPVIANDTGDPRQFDLNDCFAIPGLFNFGTPGAVPITGKGVEIINGKACIQIDGSENMLLKNDNGQFKLDGTTGQFNVNNGNLTVDP